MDSTTVPLLEPSPEKPTNSSLTQSKDDDDFSAQRQRRQNCLLDVKRRRTCEGSIAEVAKLLKEELKQDEIGKKIGSDVALHRLRVMNHNNFRKLSEQRNIHLPVDMSDIRRTVSAQPYVSVVAEDDLSPISRVTSDKSLPNERSFSGSHSFLQRSSSGSKNGGEKSVSELMDIRIFFPDCNCVQFTVEDGRHASAAYLLALVAKHSLKIPINVANDCFAIWLTSDLLEVQLKPHHIAADVRNKWPAFLRKYTDANEADIVVDEPLLILKRNVSLSIDTERQIIGEKEGQELKEYSENLVHALYIDAKDEYLSGRYLVDVETALDLAALQILIEYGSYDGKDNDYKDLVHLQLADFVPAQHLSKIQTFQLFGLSIMECKAGLEKDLLERYKQYSEKYGEQTYRKIAYLNFLRDTPFYGAAFFNGKTERRASAMPLLDFGKRLFTAYMPTSKMNVRIGIQTRYITVVDPVKHEVLLTQKLEDCSWLENKDVQSPELFLHFLDPAYVHSNQDVLAVANGEKAAPPSKILQIFSRQTCMMVALLNCLNQILMAQLIAAQQSSSYGSAHDLHNNHQTEHHTIVSSSDNSNVPSADETDDSHSPNTTVSFNSKKSKTAGSLGSRSTHTRSSSSSRDSIYSNYKLSKLCLATLDSNGCCTEAHGSLKKLFVPVH